MAGELWQHSTMAQILHWRCNLLGVPASLHHVSEIVCRLVLPQPLQTPCCVCTVYACVEHNSTLSAVTNQSGENRSRPSDQEPSKIQVDTWGKGKGNSYEWDWHRTIPVNMQCDECIPLDIDPLHFYAPDIYYFNLYVANYYFCDIKYLTRFFVHMNYSAVSFIQIPVIQMFQFQICSAQFVRGTALQCRWNWCILVNVTEHTAVAHSVEARVWSWAKQVAEVRLS